MARPKKQTEPILSDVENDTIVIETATTEQNEEQKPVRTASVKKKEADIPDFNYRNLTGDEFKRYNEHIGTLLLNKHYDFILMKVTPVFVDRYPGLIGSPRDFDGVLLKNDTPEHTTRIPLSYANEYNQQIFNDAAKRNGKYYLLKK